MLRRCALVLVPVVACVGQLRAESPKRWTLDVELDGQQIEGMPLVWSDTTAYLLARDGKLWQFDPDDATSLRKKASQFTSYSAADIRTRLKREFGNAFEVTGSGHYLVVHPRGERDVWGKRFEELYRSFVHYFAVRGFNVREPIFPLIAVVLPNQQEFFRYAAREKLGITRDTLGFYSPLSNRIVLFDVGAGSSNAWQSQQNAETIIHEAAHQTAFNTGIHTRFSEQPRWVVEGLGVLFEAPGIWNSRVHAHESDRIHHGRLQDFKSIVNSGGRKFSLAEQIASDRPFKVDPRAAYADAWALTYWLVDTRPTEYSRYLKRVADRDHFGQYTAKQRLADFKAIFGDDLKMVEARFLRYMDRLN